MKYEMKVTTIEPSRASISVRLAGNDGIDWTRDVASDELPIQMLLIARVTLSHRKGQVVTIRFRAPENARFLDDEGNHVHLRMPQSGEVEIQRPIEFTKASRRLDAPWLVVEV